MGKGILLVGNHPPPYGGVPSHIKYLAPYLVSQGWKVHVLSLAELRSRVKGKKENADGYTIHHPPRYELFIKLLKLGGGLRSPLGFKRFVLEDLRRYLSFFAIVHGIREIVQRYDIGMISAYHFLAGLAAGWACEDLSLPLITTVFGEIYADTEFYQKRKDEVEFVCNRSHKMLSCSMHCAKSLDLFGLSGEVETVYYGIDTSVFRPENDGGILRTKLGIGRNERVVTFVGRMEEEMGLHILLESIPKVLEARDDIRFIIAGKRGGLSPRAEDLESKNPGAIHVLQDIPSDELPLIYAASNLTVVPSINDRSCLGLAIAEAMATGKPVIVSDVGGGREIMVADETGILVEPSNPDALAEAVMQLVKDDHAISKMGSNGRKRAVEVFDKESTNRRIETIFSRVFKAGNLLPKPVQERSHQPVN